MILEIHDSEPGNSLAGRVNELDYDYQAEQWVQDIIKKESTIPQRFPLAKFILKDSEGERATWEVVENFGVKLATKSIRFQGEWVLESVFR